MKFSSIQHGFHLIELLITLCIVCLLSAIIFPNYQYQIAQVNRKQVIHELLLLASALEEFAFTHITYDGATLKKLNAKEFVVKNNYQLVIQQAIGNQYVIAAAPINKQAELDQACGTLIYNQKGMKSVSGNENWQDCWN